MADSNKGTGVSEPQQEADLEKGDHGVPPNNGAEKDQGADVPGASSEETAHSKVNHDTSSQSNFELLDEADPFALFPTVSLSKSSTQGPWMRRNTTASIGRALTREQTRETLRSVRSRFTEVRDEFDENVSHT